jgi:hypothetical protein
VRQEGRVHEVLLHETLLHQRGLRKTGTGDLIVPTSLPDLGLSG